MQHRSIQRLTSYSLRCRVGCLLAYAAQRRSGSVASSSAASSSSTLLYAAASTALEWQP